MVIYELFDSYLNLRKNTTLYSKKQLLGFKKDCTDISPHRFSKLSGRDATHFGGARIQFSDGNSALIRFDEQTVGRYQAQGCFLELLSKREIETMLQVLLRQCRLATKTMNYPRIRRAQDTLHFQQFIGCLYQMNHQRLSRFLCQACLVPKYFHLQIHRSIRQLVQPGLAHGKYLGMTRQFFQATRPAIRDTACYGMSTPAPAYMPRVYPYGIPSAALWRERLGIAIHNGRPGHLRKPVCMYVCRNIHGTGSYPEPPQGWQRRMRLTAR